MKAMKMDNDRVRSLIVESITSLCCSEFKFKDRLKVEGLLGITIDEVEVFLVSFNETFIHGNHAMAAVVGSEFFDAELLKNQHSNHLPSISQQLPGLNENTLALMAAKKQKLDLNDLQNMTQFLTSATSHQDQANNNDMDGVIICDGDTLSQSDLENASNLADMSQNDNSNNWNIPFNKLLPGQQQQQLNLEKEKEKVMAAALAAMRQQQFLHQTPDQTLVTVNNVAALQQQLRNNYLAVQQQQQSERDDQSTATTLEQIQYDTHHALEQSVAVASAALQQQFAINLADQTGLGLLSNKALVSGLILDQLQQHCVVDEDGQQQVAQAAQALFQRHQDNQHNQSQTDDDSNVDNKKNASLLQALSGAASSLNANASLHLNHLTKQQQLRQNDQAEALILHLKPGGSSSAGDVLNNNNNNLLESSGQTSNEDDDDNVDSKLWMSSANNDILSNAPPVYSGLLATTSSASSSSTSPSPTWLAHHHPNQQQAMKISPGGSIENHLTNSLMESSSSNQQAALALSNNQFLVSSLYSSTNQTNGQPHAFNLSDLMQQEQLLQQQQLQQQIQQQQQTGKSQARQQTRGRKESRRSWTSNNKPNSCPHSGCNKTYFFTHDLKRHLRQKHDEVVVGETFGGGTTMYTATTQDRNNLRQQQQQLQQQLQAHQLILNDRKDFLLLMPSQLTTKSEITDDSNNLSTGNTSSLPEDIENVGLTVAGTLNNTNVVGIVDDKTQGDEIMTT